MDFTVPADHRVKLKKSEKKEKYHDLAREMKNKQTVEYENDGYTNCKGFIKGLEFLEIRELAETIQTNSIAEINENTEKSPGNLRRLLVT